MSPTVRTCFWNVVCYDKWWTRTLNLLIRILFTEMRCFLKLLRTAILFNFGIKFPFKVKPTGLLFKVLWYLTSASKVLSGQNISGFLNTNSRKNEEETWLLLQIQSRATQILYYTFVSITQFVIKKVMFCLCDHRNNGYLFLRGPLLRSVYETS